MNKKNRLKKSMRLNQPAYLNDFNFSFKELTSWQRTCFVNAAAATNW